MRRQHIEELPLAHLSPHSPEEYAAAKEKHPVRHVVVAVALYRPIPDRMGETMTSMVLLHQILCPALSLADRHGNDCADFESDPSLFHDLASGLVNLDVNLSLVLLILVLPQRTWLLRKMMADRTPTCPYLHSRSLSQQCLSLSFLLRCDRRKQSQKRRSMIDVRPNGASIARKLISVECRKETHRIKTSGRLTNRSCKMTSD